MLVYQRVYSYMGGSHSWSAESPRCSSLEYYSWSTAKNFENFQTGPELKKSWFQNLGFLLGCPAGSDRNDRDRKLVIYNLFTRFTGPTYKGVKESIY